VYRIQLVVVPQVYYNTASSSTPSVLQYSWQPKYIKLAHQIDKIQLAQIEMPERFLTIIININKTKQH